MSSVNPTDLRQILPKSVEMTALKQAEANKINIDQTHAKTENEKKSEHDLKTVLDAQNADGSKVNSDGKGQGYGSSQNSKKKQKQHEEEKIAKDPSRGILLDVKI